MTENTITIPVDDSTSTEVTLDTKKDVRPLFQQRVVQEKVELDDKIINLDKFLLTETFHGLPAAEQDRLERQFDVMKEYASILGERIAAFPAPSLTIVP